jgi:hypothetical protein
MRSGTIFKSGCRPTALAMRSLLGSAAALLILAAANAPANGQNAAPVPVQQLSQPTPPGTIMVRGKLVPAPPATTAPATAPGAAPATTPGLATAPTATTATAPAVGPTLAQLGAVDPSKVEPPKPDWPVNNQPTPAKVTWDSQGLAIDANNSRLDAILKEISTQTGAKLDGEVGDERVFGIYGPGPARDVITQLLDGTPYNVLMVGDQGEGTPREIELSNRPKGPAPANRGGGNSNDDDSDYEAQQPQVPQAPLRGAPFQQGNMPPDVQSRQERLEQLREMREQQQQQQGEQQPQQPVQPGQTPQTPPQNQQ